MAERIIYCTGVMRSGTTLLQRIVCSAPDANDLIPEVRSPGALAKNRPDCTTEDLRECFEQEWEKHGSPKLFVCKNPLAVDYAYRFLELDNLQIILIRRDPIEILNSVWAIREKYLAAGTDNNLTAMSDEELVDFVYEMSLSTRRLENHERVLIVRYEKIVSKDAETLDRMSDFVGARLSYDLPDLSSTFNKEHPFFTRRTGRVIVDEQPPITLPAEVLRYAEKWNDARRDLGYPPEETIPSTTGRTGFKGWASAAGNRLLRLARP